MKQKNTRQQINSKILRVLMSLLVMGLAAPAHAQECNPVELAKLLPTDGGTIENWFGYSVSISDDTAIVGAWRDNSVYIFIQSEGVWVEQAELLQPGETSFGFSVSISGDTVLIGEWGTETGSAYVFTRDGDVWTQQAKLLPADEVVDSRFGWSVSIDNDTAVIGAYGSVSNGRMGSAYVFTRNANVWTQQAKLIAADMVSDDRFGTHVAISDDTIIIGARQDDENGTNSGSAYAFVRSGNTWIEQAKLLPTDGAENDVFGWTVSIDGNTALIGARHDADNGHRSGSAYVFTRTAGAWTQQAKLLPSDGIEEERFGWSVSVHNDMAIIGKPWSNDSGRYSGSAYIFTRNEGTWTQHAKLLPADGARENLFGAAVAINDDQAVIGAPHESPNLPDLGSTYIFNLDCNDCPSDMTGNGALDIFDVFAFLDAYNNNDLAADFTGDGIISILDTFAFLDSYNTGCP